jgi:NitT/TauT family transport system ATP-binding protein
VSDPDGTAIVLSDISKIFPLRDRQFVALQGINLTVRDGEFCSIIGPSGCGKSTLLRIIADVVAPTSGHVSVLGGPAADARKRRQFGFVFQEPALLPWLTTRANVELPLIVAGVHAEQRRRRADAMLALVGLTDFSEAHPAQLSGGMARRVAIARGLVLGPQVLLLDEPFGGLDEITRQRMNVELQRIWGSARTTACLVTHNVGEAVFLSDRVFVMATGPGRVVSELPIELPRPRTLDLLRDQRFFEYTSRLVGLLGLAGSPA